MGGGGISHSSLMTHFSSLYTIHIDIIYGSCAAINAAQIWCINLQLLIMQRISHPFKNPWNKSCLLILSHLISVGVVTVLHSLISQKQEFNPHLKLIHYTLLAQSYMLLCVESYIHWEIVINPFLELHACNAIHADRSVHSIITYSCLDSIQ